MSGAGLYFLSNFKPRFENFKAIALKSPRAFSIVIFDTLVFLAFLANDVIPAPNC